MNDEEMAELKLEGSLHTCYYCDKLNVSYIASNRSTVHVGFFACMGCGAVTVKEPILQMLSKTIAAVFDEKISEVVDASVTIIQNKTFTSKVKQSFELIKKIWR